MGSRVHPTAVVDSRAELADDVEVGPYAVVGAGAQIGAGSSLSAHAVVLGPATLGAGNVVHPFALIGGPPQDKRSFPSGESRLVVGERNTFREHVTVHRGTEGRPTRIGSDNLFMVGAHVAHDATVGSFCTFANAVQLAGHATVEDHATFGGLSGVAQFVTVGQSAFVAAGAMCERRVPPFVIVQGDRARVRALNVVGLRRRGISEVSIARLQAAFRALFGGGSPRVAALRDIPRDDPLVSALLDALADTRNAGGREAR
jgi:UDP-N-acetylglucosamine acyltransferase